MWSSRWPSKVSRTQGTFRNREERFKIEQQDLAWCWRPLILAHGRQISESSRPARGKQWDLVSKQVYKQNSQDAKSLLCTAMRGDLLRWLESTQEGCLFHTLKITILFHSLNGSSHGVALGRDSTEPLLMQCYSSPRTTMDTISFAPCHLYKASVLTLECLCFVIVDTELQRR